MKTEPSSKFIKIRCPKCKNELLAESTGGKTKPVNRVLEVLE